MKRTLCTASIVATALVAATVAFGATTLATTSDKSGRLAYNVKALTATHGKVTITMKNLQPLAHNIAIKATKSSKKPIVKGQVVGKGKTSKVSATLKAGSYVFYCTVAGHEAGGMWGTLKVK